MSIGGNLHKMCLNFGLRSLLLVLTAAALLLSGWSIWASQSKGARDEIANCGGTVKTVAGNCWVTLHSDIEIARVANCLRWIPNLCLTLRGENISDVGLSKLTSMPNLRHVTLCWTRTTHIGLLALKGTNLQHLRFDGVPVTPETIQALRHMPELISVHLGTAVIDAEVATLLGTLPSLRYVGVCVDGGDFAGLTILAKHLPRHIGYGAD